MRIHRQVTGDMSVKDDYANIEFILYLWIIHQLITGAHRKCCLSISTFNLSPMQFHENKKKPKKKSRKENLPYDLAIVTANVLQAQRLRR